MIGDSSATVIGAMIVAPLMTPILGTMLSIVLTDWKNFVASFLILVTGIGSCVLTGFAVAGHVFSCQRERMRRKRELVSISGIS